eukprot:TRINITY_DN20533_c0_g1_i1.p1 TRINITY_DN20533_c0_g1~~TRINITY_DN20533_c0_g1_i1.p1  ORF type:complete len:496 (-),score=70.28 TRINITY_DN20533_c0_g1_i1:150-1637(-)
MARQTNSAPIGNSCMADEAAVPEEGAVDDNAVAGHNDNCVLLMDGTKVHIGTILPTADSKHPFNETPFLDGIGQHLLYIAALFAWTSFRTFIIPLWTTEWYVPVVSPVAEQGHNWIKTTPRTVAILLHVFFGIVMTACAMVQFDKQARRTSPLLHRISGRLYVFSGLVAVGSLRYLRESVGQGRGTEPVLSMQLGIDAACILWPLFTGLSVYYAVAKDFDKHRRLMVMSVGVMMAPIFQRIFIWFPLTPLAMFLRLALDALVGIPPWQSHWPDSSGDWASWAAVDPGSMLQHSASTPRVMSLEGYSVAEKVSFGASSWGGLSFIVLLAYLLQKREVMWNLHMLKHFRLVVEAADYIASKLDGVLKMITLDPSNDSLLNLYGKAPAFCLKYIGPSPDDDAVALLINREHTDSLFKSMTLPALGFLPKTLIRLILWVAVPVGLFFGVFGFSAAAVVTCAIFLYFFLVTDMFVIFMASLVLCIAGFGWRFANVSDGQP